MNNKIQRPLPATGGKSRFHLFVAAAMAFAGFPINGMQRTPKINHKPKPNDQDAILKAELKRTRKAAKRLRDSCTF